VKQEPWWDFGMEKMSGDSIEEKIQGTFGISLIRSGQAYRAHLKAVMVFASSSSKSI
jgi:hypothetical protein